MERISDKTIKNDCNPIWQRIEFIKKGRLYATAIIMETINQEKKNSKNPIKTEDITDTNVMGRTTLKDLIPEGRPLQSSGGMPENFVGENRDNHRNC